MVGSADRPGAKSQTAGQPDFHAGPRALAGNTVAGEDYSRSFMLRGMVRHIVYHSGQIALLSKMG